MLHIIKQYKSLFFSSIFLSFEQNTNSFENIHKIEEKDLSKEDIEKATDLDSISSIINNRKIDLLNSEHKDFVKSFLEKISKNNGKDKIQEDDVNESIWSSERQAFNKVVDLVKTLSEYKDVKSKFIGYTKEELSMLNDFIGAKDIIKKDSEEELCNLSYEIDKNNPEHIYRILFNNNNDNVLDKKDKNILNSVDIYKYIENMILSGKEGNLLVSISHILGEKVSSKQELFDLFQKSPEKRDDFIQKLKNLSKATFVTDILEYGDKAFTKSLEKKEEINSYLESLIDKEKTNFDKNYDKSISNFESNLSPEDKEKYKEFLEKIKCKENKDELFENFRLNGVGILISLVETKKGLGAGSSFSNIDLDTYLKEKTNEIVSGINFNLGLVSIGGKIVPGVGVNVNFSKDFSEDLRGFGTIGIINLIPFALVGIEKQINREELEKAGFINLEKAEYVGATVNVMPMGWGVGAHYKQDLLKGIEISENNFNTFLDNFLTKDGINNEVLISQEDYKKEYKIYDKLSNDIEELFRIVSFDSLDNSEKQNIIYNLKKGLSNTWREGALKRANEEGYKWSGVGIGIQFIAGFLPLPYIGARWSKVDMNYKEDKNSKTEAILSESLSSVNQSIEIDNGIFESKENIFRDNLKLFQSIAIRHSTDWPKLVNAKDFDSKVDSIIAILSTDPKYKNTKIFKGLLSDFQTLKNSDGESDKIKLNILVAQFFDVSFKDKRSIEEIIIGFTKNSKLEYEGTNDFIFGNDGSSGRYKTVGEFSREEGLSHEFLGYNTLLYGKIQKTSILEFINNNKDKYDFGELKKNISNSSTVEKNDIRKFLNIIRNDINSLEIPQVKKPDLYGFVASYKLKANGKDRLATGFVDMPAGQVTVAGGIEETVTNQKDKDWVTDRFVNNEYGKKSMEQILSILDEKGINLTIDEFKTLLSKGEFKKDNKNLKLDREFVNFLYGICSNESIGVRIKSLKIDGLSLDFGNIGPDGILRIKANTTNNIIGENINIDLGIIAGGDDNGGDTTTLGTGNGDTTTGGTGNGDTTGGTGNGNVGGGPVGGFNP